jgi:hypothetical protein
VITDPILIFVVVMFGLNPAPTPATTSIGEGVEVTGGDADR